LGETAVDRAGIEEVIIVSRQKIEYCTLFIANIWLTRDNSCCKVILQK
jgi:hypothetical protein